MYPGMFIQRTSFEPSESALVPGELGDSAELSILTNRAVEQCTHNVNIIIGQ